MNYPDNAPANAPDAPWNQPTYDAEYAMAVRMVTGLDGDLTAQAFSEFLLECDERQTPMLRPGVISGPISNAELLHLLLSSTAENFVLSAAQELRARYLASDSTKFFIDREHGKLIEQGQA